MQLKQVQHKTCPAVPAGSYGNEQHHLLQMALAHSLLAASRLSAPTCSLYCWSLSQELRTATAAQQVSLVPLPATPQPQRRSAAILAWGAMAQAPHAPLDAMVQGATRCVHACGVQGTALLPSANGTSNLMRSMICCCLSLGN